MSTKSQIQELTELCKIYMSEVSDWHLQAAHLIGNHEFDKAADMLAGYNISLHKLAGAISKLTQEDPKLPWMK